METREFYSGAFELPLYKSEPLAKTSAAVNEIVFDELGEGDLFLLQTHNSTYSFSVTDVKKRRGILTGGSLGKKRLRAFFICTENDQDKSATSISTRLFIGARAIFAIVERPGTSTHLMTSEIMTLSLIKADVRVTQ
jgi:hypothetical protein